MLNISEPGFKALRASRAESINLRQRRTWYADGGEGDDGKQAGTDTQPDKTGDEGQSTDTTFTQADLDRLVGSARKQARESVRNDLLKELGFESADDLKAMVTSAREKADAEKSDLEKAQAEIERWKKQAEEAQTARQEAEQERMEERRQSAILNALKEAKKPSDVLILVNARFTEDVAGVMSDDGALDEKALKSLVEKVKKEWPDQFGSSSPGSPSNAGGKVPTANKDDIRKSIRVRY